MIADHERTYLERSVALAREALAAGDEPFGSVLVSADGKVLMEDRNRIAGGNATRHPEIALAYWAVENLTPEERAAATVYTSGEHCPMCAAAHGWVGLGRIVYVSSSRQLGEWLSAMNVSPAPVATLPIEQIVPGLAVDGPVPDMAATMQALHREYHHKA
ncbi:nucleoside deaminase [Vreelandella subglaciescola]|jgi:tRNA(Arg) A34 adenosine deaminase TadA|uniref:tRNA(Arg) A34 adenosine deaminase TadA n=1 Tax=Vreelandella subglaciescola TaxID=29571 RepID=A0A1M7I7V3_9GAMM|nr:nucleoside deaminase [Halomonas subglaciescola]SHM36824.1 tRNA(Arg) A34 adenosine deaminase TadA [Halomonas subglaciescola]